MHRTALLVVDDWSSRCAGHPEAVTLSVQRGTLSLRRLPRTGWALRSNTQRSRICAPHHATKTAQWQAIQRRNSSSAS